MGHRTTTFEVEVLIKSKKPIGYRSDKSLHFFEETVRMFHITARTAKQAMARCEKKGRPLSARKIDTAVMFKNIEELPIQNDIYVNKNPYPDPIAMDEMIWMERNGGKNK